MGAGRTAARTGLSRTGAGSPDVGTGRVGARHAICRLDDLPMEAARGFDPWGTGEPVLFVVRKADGLHAYADVCPHYGRTRLAWKADAYLNVAATEIRCAAHNAAFRIDDGVCIRGPCLGQRLATVDVAVEDGVVSVDSEQVAAAWRRAPPDQAPER